VTQKPSLFPLMLLLLLLCCSLRHRMSEEIAKALTLHGVLVVRQGAPLDAGDTKGNTVCTEVALLLLLLLLLLQAPYARGDCKGTGEAGRSAGRW
jgi:hypothetical protein